MVIVFSYYIVSLRRRNIQRFVALLIGAALLINGVWWIHDYTHIAKAKDLKHSHYNADGRYYDSKNPDTYKHTSMREEILDINIETNESNKERVNRWIVGMEFFLSHPITGLGPGTFGTHYQKYVVSHPDQAWTTISTKKMNIHNHFLSWLVEGGILLFLAGLVLTLVLVRGIWVNFFTKKTIYIKIFLSGFFISFLLHGMLFDFNQEVRIMVLFWFVLGVSRSMFFFPKEFRRIYTNPCSGEQEVLDHQKKTETA
jgi:hypothetical protein